MPGDAWTERVAAIVLAAGASTRLGTPKQHVLYQGEPLVRRAARSALEAGASPVLVVLGAALRSESDLQSRRHTNRLHINLDRSAQTSSQRSPNSTITDVSSVQALAGLPVTVVANPDHATGMGSSLRAGMAALLAAPHEPHDGSVQSQAVAGAGTPEPAAPDRVLLLVADQPLVTAEHLRLLLSAPAPDGIVAAAYNGRLGVPAIFSRQHFTALAAAEGDQGARTLLRTLPATPFDLPEAAVDIDTPDDLRQWIAKTP